MHSDKGTYKKGLVYIGTPKHLLDFLWFYAAGHSHAAYYCICAGSSKEDPLYKACLRSGVFKRTRYVPSFFKLPLRELLSVNAGLVFSCITRTKSYYAKKLLCRYSGGSGYDFFVSPCSLGLLPGLMIFLSREYRVYQLEDGINDYTEKSPSLFVHIKKALGSPKYLYFLFLLKAGFTDCTLETGLEGDRYCIKYVSHPSLLKYRNFKEIRRLYDPDADVGDRYLSYVDKAFKPVAVPLDAALLILTTVLSIYPIDEKAVTDKICQELCRRFPGEKAIMKRHPRDSVNCYVLPGIETAEVDNSIPGELLIHRFPGITIASFSMSSLLLDAAAKGSRILIFRIRELYYNDAGASHYRLVFDRGMELLSKAAPKKTEVIDI